jgi:hypothetical protein
VELGARKMQKKRLKKDQRIFKKSLF